MSINIRRKGSALSFILINSSYLADKNKLSQQIYPKDLETRARVDEYLMWQFRNVHVPCGTYFLKGWLLPINGLAPKPKPEVVAKLVKDVETSLDLLERFWMNDDYLVGDKLTVADLSCSSEIEQLSKRSNSSAPWYSITNALYFAGLCQFHVNERQFPKVAKWLERVRIASKPYNDIAYEFVNQKAKQAAKL